MRAAAAAGFTREGFAVVADVVSGAVCGTLRDAALAEMRRKSRSFSYQWARCVPACRPLFRVCS